MSDQPDEPTPTRREAIAGGALGTAAATAPARAPLVIGDLVPSQSLTTLAVDGPDAQQTWGPDSSPMWLLGLDRDELVDEDDDPEDEQLVDPLETWVTDHDDRELIASFDTLDVAVVAAPRDDIGAQTLDRLRNQGLQNRDWIKYVDANIQVSLTDPLNSWELDEDDTDLSYAVDPAVARDVTPSNAGLAFEEDAPEVTVGDVWDAVAGRDHGVDTSDLLAAVIDTGVTDSSEFRDDEDNPRITDGSADTTGSDTETVDDEGIQVVEDGNGHGDWVASAMLADHDDTTYDGALTEADILALKALGDDGSGSTESILRAVEHAIDEGADIACMSLGTPLYSQALADAIEQATDEGMVVAVAAGNDRFGTTFTNHPANVDEAISVSALTGHDDIEETMVANFANVGPHDGVLDQSGGESAGATNDIAAPGMEIEANTPDGTDRLSGTSMAAPFVAAAAGVLVADGVDGEDVRDRLTDAADPIEQAGVNEVGAGRLNVDRALAGDESEDDQADERDADAESRDASLEAYSSARGGPIGRFLAEDLEEV